MVAIATENITKVFDDGAVALDGVTLAVEPGTFLAVLGPSGAGKSTLLRLIAGLERPTRGAVLFDGRPVDELPPRDRGVAMVIQDYTLYPHLTVAQNIGFPLRALNDRLGEVAPRVAEAAQQVGVADLLNRLPDHLSEGQRQRVAIARALIRRPRIFLLDEPLSHVDSVVRAELRAEIVGLTERLGITTVYVTQDQTEALNLAHQIAVLRRGMLEQIGPPHQVYGDPNTIFVAAFLGMPPTNLLEGAIYADGDRVVVDLGAQVLELPVGDPRTAVLARRHTERVTVGLRADALTPVAAGGTGLVVRGEVRQVEHLGHDALVHLDTGGVCTSAEAARLESRAAARRSDGGPTAVERLTRLIPGQRRETTSYGLRPAYDVDARDQPAPAGEIVVRIPGRRLPGRGESVTLAVDLDRLLLFDREGERIRLA